MKSYITTLLTAITIAMLGLFAFKKCSNSSRAINVNDIPVVAKSDTIYLERTVVLPPDTVYKTIVKTKTIHGGSITLDTSDISVGKIIVRDSFIHDTIIERSVEFLPDPNGTLVTIDTVVDKQIVEVPVTKPKFKFYAGAVFSSSGFESSGPMITVTHDRFQLSVIKPLNNASSFEIAAQFRLGKRKR